MRIMSLFFRFVRAAG